MFEEGFRCGVSRIIVVEVQSNLFIASVIQVGQGASPQVGGVQDNDRTFRDLDLLQGQVGQEVHEAFEDLEQPSVCLLMHRDIFPRPDEALKFGVTRLKTRSSRVS